MYIVTDDKIYTEKLFSELMDWYTPEINRLSEEIGPLSKILFKDDVYLCSITSDFSNWDFLFIAKYSETSQFDILNKFLSENELQYNVLIIAGSGQKFHGFRNREWASLPGNLHLTTYIKCEIPSQNSSAEMMVLSSVSCIEAIETFSNKDISYQIKWMNDIIINGSKAGGIITQGRLQGNLLNNVLIGIGLNINTVPEVQRNEVIPKVTSLSKELNSGSIDLISFLKVLSKLLLKNIELIKTNKYDLLYKKYLEHSCIIGKNIKIISDPIKGESEKLFEGIVETISNKLEIKLKNSNKLITKGRIVALEV